MTHLERDETEVLSAKGYRRGLIFAKKGNWPYQPNFMPSTYIGCMFGIGFAYEKIEEKRANNRKVINEGKVLTLKRNDFHN